MRILAIVLIFAAAAFAYKDAFYIGYYGESESGKFDEPLKDSKIKSDGYSKGFRLGWSQNMRAHFLAKIRWELFYEDRSLEVGGGEVNGWHGGGSVSWGWNTDLFLNQELVPYIKLGAGAGEFGREAGHGTNAHLGVGLAFAFKYLEITCEARREFWQLNGYRLPFSAPFNGTGSLDALSAGINIRF